jgi:hypothetical protein
MANSSEQGRLNLKVQMNVDAIEERLKLVVQQHGVSILIIFGFSLLVGMLTRFIIPNGGRDMLHDILPSLHNWRHPWEEGTPLMPWSVILLSPPRFASPLFATVLMNMASIMLTAMMIRKWGGNILMTIPLFISPIGFWLFTTGQTDALVLAGFVLLPEGYDLLFFWKPQVILHAYWVRVLRKPMVYIVWGGLLAIVSLLIWGNWPLAIYEFGRDKLIEGWWNRSLWPYSIPVGLVLLYFSIKKKDESLGIVASPLLSPYVNGPSYLGLAAVIAARRPRLFLLLYACMWLYILFRWTI